MLHRRIHIQRTLAPLGPIFSSGVSGGEGKLAVFWIMVRIKAELPHECFDVLRKLPSFLSHFGFGTFLNAFAQIIPKARIIQCMENMLSPR
jgi:hypothetical protein